MVALQLPIRTNSPGNAQGPRWITGSGLRVVEFVGLAAVSLAVAVLCLPTFNEAIIVSVIRETAQEHGLDADDFTRMAEIESAFDPFALHPVSRASGLFQFLPSTARQYKLNAAFNPRANADAAARLWRDNARMLRKRLGREPSPGELYLAHQQGATGATKLLMHPGKAAGDVVGYDAVTMNGGTEDMTARAFAAMWIDRFHAKEGRDTRERDGPSLQSWFNALIRG
jgi:hypothetical protein